jgi:uncharacterized membrane protein
VSLVGKIWPVALTSIALSSLYLGVISGAEASVPLLLAFYGFYRLWRLRQHSGSQNDHILRP